MENALAAAETAVITKTTPPSATQTSDPPPISSAGPAEPAKIQYKGGSASGDMDQQRPPPPPPPLYDNRDSGPSTPRAAVDLRPRVEAEGDARSTFRGPGGSPILERTSPVQHRPYQPSSSMPPVAGDRREPSSVSPTLTRQETNPMRMLPPPSPPAQRAYTGLDLPPLSSLTTGLPHRPQSSSGMPLSGMLGAPSPSGDMGMHPHHHHHPPHHHHHRSPRPYTPEYGNPLAPSPSSSSSNPLASRSQSTPTTPALGYPEPDSSGHGRSNSYSRLPTTAPTGVLPSPFRDPSYRPYMSREPPPPPPRDDFPPRQREVMSVDTPPSPPPQHLSDLPKPSVAPPYPHQPKHVALTAGIPTPPPHQASSRPITNGSVPARSSTHHHHHHRPPSQPLGSRQLLTPQPRPTPKVNINNTPALDAVAHINPKPFLGRFIYEPGWIIPTSVAEDNLGGRFEVRIPHRFLSRESEGVVKRKLWGTGVYTDDSDVVAGTPSHETRLMEVLFHMQILPVSLLSPPKDLAAHFIILPTLRHYAPSTFNEIRSRGWKAHDGYSIFLDRVNWIELGSAEGVWRGRKRRLDEERRMGVEGEEVGVGEQETASLGGFRGVNWNAEQLSPRKKVGRVGVVA